MARDTLARATMQVRGYAARACNRAAPTPAPAPAQAQAPARSCRANAAATGGMAPDGSGKGR
ncbi:hypothetical protein EGT41_01110 [Burkholderia cenocepacia]|uniref:Uncharacterized protein n=1 Tax=Burkholderia cenocepacia TaxID=95486 RepID=A0A427NX39_9BURK|nr:hypothetical protein EGT41_01110 [Burkholderia cenocepacia]